MYDYVFITHLPSFYKVNLYNQLATKLNIYVIFVAATSSIRTSDFVGSDMCFHNIILHKGDFESRPKFSCCVKLSKLLFQLKFRTLVVGGWDLLEFWIAVMVSGKARNAIAVESTIMESSTSKIKLYVKKIFLSRITTAFPSGILQQNLLNSLGHNGACFMTGGVGIFKREKYSRISKEFSGSFLYVGRLSQEKNLRFLIDAFNDLPHLQLTIVGSGPLSSELMSVAHGNITFRPHVPNSDIGKIYLAHDIFVLPSLAEPWGLVVDEALHYGLPVIVSKNVGCHTELVKEGMTGLIFDPCDRNSLITALLRAAEPSTYFQMKRYVEQIDFGKRDADQLMAYVHANSATRGAKS